MLLLEEAIRTAVAQYGNTIIPLEAFSLDKDTIQQDMFLPALREYQEFFPNVKTKTISAGSTGSDIYMNIPDCIGSPMSLRFGGYPNVPSLNSRYKKPDWSWDFQTKTIHTVMGGGPWIVTYAANYQVGMAQVYETYTTLKDEDEVSFKIRGEFKGKSLKITRKKDGLSMKVTDVYTKDGLTYGELAGTLGTGRICLNDLRCKLELDSTRDDQLIIEYMSKYKAVQELTFQNQEFLLWFASKLLTSIGSLKLMTQMDGMPFNISIDDLRTRGLELVNQVETDLKVQKQEFYSWTGNKY
jgi:hypothetical protein